MDSTMQAWRKKMPSKRAIASTLNQLVQQKSVAVLYTPTEVERIKQMTDMIREATSEFKVEEDWDRILKVVDALSNVSNRAVLKESIWYLKLRLGDPSCRVVILSLTLTESIVKNCGDLVHLEIATEHFMNEMEALYKAHANKRGRESMEISSRVLDMIQAWGEAFLPFRHELPLFVDTYHNMRKKGIKFPDQYDQTKVPVLTPSVDLREGVQNRALDRWSMLSNKSQNFSSIDTSSYSNSSSGLGGLSTPELHRVATNVLEMFEDMLFAAQTNSSLIDCHGIMVELSVEVREIMRRLEGAIPIAVVEEDKNLEKYLSLNDDVHAALKKYDVLLAGYQDANAIASLTSNASAIDLMNSFGSEDNAILQSDEEKQSSSDDDPFRDFVLTRTGPKGIVSTSAQVLTKSEPETNDLFETPLQNEDPFASFVQQRATKIPNTRSNQKAEEESKLAATATSKASVKDLINLWDGETVAMISAMVDFTDNYDEQMFQRWLQPLSMSLQYHPKACG
ncbi:hypothetical protein CCR75_009203 [Bremia lactucae]|uniref:VHS domain-containing protein n=1 Tax=Bremia lactucae TaxID=4779 RepID=A0A976FIZ4_BRELC|nr:hypothetical protein CCR75_009203 [Bremia lactucae]